MQASFAAPSRALVLSRTLLGLASVLVGSWALERVHGGWGWLYAGAFLLHVWGFYPRYLCLHCPHYGRICPSGGGKIAALFYDRARDSDDPQRFARRKRLGYLAGIALRAGPITLLTLQLGTTHRADPVVWSALGILLVLGFAEGKLYSSRACPACRARANCPARWSALPPSHDSAEADPT